MLSRLVTSFLLVSVLLVSLAAPVAAVEQSPGEEPAAETTAVVSDYQPAVEVDLRAEADAGQQPWTTRFLVPTTVVLGALVVFVTVVQYFTRVVKNRYKVIE
jgi:hypothetical protein